MSWQLPLKKYIYKKMPLLEFRVHVCNQWNKKLTQHEDVGSLKQPAIGLRWCCKLDATTGLNLCVVSVFRLFYVILLDFQFHFCCCKKWTNEKQLTGAKVHFSLQFQVTSLWEKYTDRSLKRLFPSHSGERALSLSHLPIVTQSTTQAQGIVFPQ